MKFTSLLLTTGLLLLSLRSLCAAEYRPVTPREARKVLLRFCRGELEGGAKRSGKPALPYRAVFERAEAGDIPALKTVYFDLEYLGGENENHDVVPGMMCIAVGDRRITAFLRSLSVRERRDTLDQIIRCFIPPTAYVLPFTGEPPHEPTPSEVGEAHRWLREHFPRLSRLDKATPASDATVPNNAL